MKTSGDSMKIKQLQQALLKSYSKDLCYEKVRDEWTEENKTLGMCAITSLVVNDYFKGDIAKIKVSADEKEFSVLVGYPKTTIDIEWMQQVSLNLVLQKIEQQLLCGLRLWIKALRHP